MTADAVAAPTVAVVGLAGRFPGAANVDEFWANLVGEVESISTLDPQTVADPAYVPAEGLLAGHDRFDAEFFGYSPREAETMDPQHRICLEAVWSAFDSAGLDPAAVPGQVGVFLSATISSYLIRNLLPDRERLDLLGGFPLLIHNDKDFLPTTVSHKLGLTGPSLAVGTACSSSLVAVHLACQSLLSFESDMAVAGGVSLLVPQGQGYVHRPDGIYSADGHCRAFGAAADGTVGGSGVGVVLLKRLDDALQAGDPVHAVIVGSAVNNDGAAKAGYTTPGVDGQAAVIAEALAVAGCAPAEVGYVEAHGTGTPIGDAVEIEALTRAFDRPGGRRDRCVIGSVKSNIGHLDAAAGVAGLIKAVLAVEHRVIPASLHCVPTNPAIDFDATPFRPADRTRAWVGGGPRTAGVSAFGIGGTNAHVVIRSAPADRQPAGTRRWSPILLSGRDVDTATAAGVALARRLRAEPDLAAVAATTAGRRALPFRAAVVADDRSTAADLLADLSVTAVGEPRPVVFSFPGQGRWAADAVAALFAEDPTWRGHVEDGLALLDAAGGPSLRPLFDGTAAIDVDDPAVGQPALFLLQHATAATLRDWGVEPVAVLGHSLGEYAAAVVAGALTVRDALAMTARRGALLAGLRGGAMLAVTGTAVDAVLPDGVELAAINSDDQFVAAGEQAAIDAFAAELVARGTQCTPLSATRAYHSAHVEPILETFGASAVSPTRPRIPLASTVSGTWLTAADPHADYWARQLRSTVRFADALAAVLDRHPDAVVIELGVGDTLTKLARRAGPATRSHVAMACLPPDQPARGLLRTATDLWLGGHRVDWSRVVESRRTRLPSRPLRPDRHWVDPPSEAAEPDRPSLTILAAGLPTAGEPGPGDDRAFRVGLDRLCAALAFEFLDQSDVDTSPGARHTAGELVAQLGVLPSMHGMIDFLVTVLVEDGVVRRSGEQVEFTDRRPTVDDLVTDIVDGQPTRRELCDLVIRCARSYPRVLSEPGAALSLLYPEGAASTTAGLSAGVDAVPARLADLLELASRMASRAGRPLRILEVGAGDGRLTEALAPALTGLGAHYLATDISRAFTTRLAAAAAERGVLVDTAVFDITADPADQHIDTGGYDLVVGLDVVHTTPDVEATLRRLTTLLGRDGLLGFVETTARDRWLSMVWGLTEAWWSFRDGRRGSPLLDAAGWQRVTSALAPVESLVLGRGGDACLVLVRPADGLAQLLRRLPAKEPDIADWAYVPSWRRLPPVRSTEPGPARCLVFSSGEVGDAVASELRALGTDVTIVRPPATPNPDADGLTVDLDDPTSYPRLLDEIGGPPDAVVHCWAVDAVAPEPLTAEYAAGSQRIGLHSVLGLVRALGAADETGPTRLVVVTAGAADVLGGDLRHPEHATLHAAVRIISREYPGLRCSVVDLPADAGPQWIAAVTAEVSTPPTAPVIAYRGTHRWAPGFEQTRLPAPGSAAPLAAGGVYLVCGGLGGIGLAIAEHLAALPATVVLTGRTAQPTESAEPGHGDRSRLAELTAAAAARGGRIVVERADITDRRQMRDVVERTVARWGRLTGVVHAAGVHDDAGMIQRRTDADTDAVIAAKVVGTVVLTEVLAGHRPRFVLLCSSIGTALPNLKFGEVGYLAAHEFSNAYAAHATQLPVIAVGWTDWLESGMWARARRHLIDRADGATAAILGADLLRGLSDVEGVAVFDRVLAARPGPHVLISTQRLDRLLAVHDAFPGVAQHASTGDLMPRPAPRNRPRRTVDPLRTHTEHLVATIWRDLLGVPEIGPTDDFFALGGDSLLALRFLALLRERTGLDQPIARMFETPTLGALAAVFDAAGGPPDDLLL